MRLPRIKAKWLPLVILALLFFTFFYLGFHRYLSYEAIKAYDSAAQRWTGEHYLLATSLYLCIYTLLIACAIPCGTFFTLLGGFLFGYIAIPYAILCTTMGGTLLYFSVRTSIGTYIAKRSSGWIKKVEHGFQKNAFNYLLMLRLMPIFPCWVSNISAGVLNVPLRTFIIATVIGVAPATIIYVLAARGLEKLFAMESTSMLLPLLGLAILSVFPVIYRVRKRKSQE